MTDLSTQLKELFVDNSKSDEMMCGACDYDPDHTYQRTVWNKETKRYENVGDPISYPIDDGYGKELQSMGVAYTSVDSYGGEGEGDTFYHVWQFDKDGETVFWKFDGWYASYSGAEYQNNFQVEPKQVTKTEYV